jgi:hypothetical protein
MRSTWSGGALRLAEDDKRFVLAITTLVQGVRADLSSPLDSATRTAAFVTKAGLAPGFRGALQIGYDSLYHALDLEPSERERLAHCEREKIDPCTVAKAIELKRQAVAANKKRGQPLDADQRYWGAGLDLSFAYDRTSAYQDDLAAAATATFRATDLQIGGSATLHVPGGRAFSARARDTSGRTRWTSESFVAAWPCQHDSFDHRASMHGRALPA